MKTKLNFNENQKARSLLGFLIALLLAIGSITSTFAQAVYQSFTEQYSRNSAAFVSKPSGVVEGDLMVISLVLDNGLDDIIVTTIPTGWTLIGASGNSEDFALRSYWKIAGASEPGTYIFGLNVVVEWVIRAIRITNADPINPIPVSSGNNGYGNVVTANGITTTQENSLVLGLYAIQKDVSSWSSFTSPMSFVANRSISGVTNMFGTFLKDTAGATGDKSADSGINNANWAAQLVAINPVLTCLQSVAPTSAVSNLENFCFDTGGTLDLTASGGLMATDAVVKWYTDSCGGTWVGTGNPLTINKPTATTTYYARYEGDCNKTTCASVEVTVATPSVAPTNASTDENDICPNTEVTLSVTGGSLGIGATWKWYVVGFGTETSIGSGDTIEVSPTATTTYYVRAEGVCNTTDCASVTVTVVAKPTIADITVPADICAGGLLDPTVPNVEANGSTVSAEGWQMEATVGGNDFANLTVPYTTINADNGKKIRYYATNACGTTYSNDVTVTVDGRPVITRIEAPAAFCAGDPFNLTAPDVDENGSTVTSEGWQMSATVGGTDFGDITVPYTISFADSGKKIRYIAENICGLTMGNQVEVTVNDKPTIAAITAPLAFCAGGSLNPTVPNVTENGSTVSAKGWQMEATVGGDDFANITVPYTTANADHGKKIRYYATNGCGTTYSNAVVVTLKAVPEITTQPADIEIVYSCNAPLLSVVATVTSGTIYYQWYKNTTDSNSGGTKILGATHSTYQTPNNYNIGTYYYYVELKANTCPVVSEVAAVTITPQSASAVGDIYYTGPSMAWITSPSSNTATVTLSATIKNSEPCGDIRTARITFTVNGQPIPSAQNLPVGLINPNNPAMGGTASAIAQLNIASNTASDLFEIGVIISGNYEAGDEYDVPGQVTVVRVKPGGVIAGGALLCNNNSTGYVKGTLVSYLNFYVEYAMKGKNVQNPKGKVSLLVASRNKPDGTIDNKLHWYSIKSNAIASLSIKTPKAIFSGKANIAEIVDGVLVPIQGNCQMVLDLKDVNLSGNFNFQDLAGITIQRNDGGIWYSNNWVSTKTVARAICGGDISVTGAPTDQTLAKTTEPAVTDTVITPEIQASDNLEFADAVNFNVTVYPNPSADYFTLKLQALPGQEAIKVEVNVFDVLGRQVYSKIGSAQDSYVFGQQFRVGIYSVTVKQGNNTASLKVIKE